MVIFSLKYSSININDDGDYIAQNMIFLLFWWYDSSLSVLTMRYNVFVKMF